MEEAEGQAKRIRFSESKEGIEGEGEGGAEREREREREHQDEDEEAPAGSEEMELQIQRVLDKINSFTQQVSELLDAVKALFKDLSTEFEDRLISIHKEQMEKWEEEIKEIRAHDSSNEASRVLLQNAQFHLFQNVREES